MTLNEIIKTQIYIVPNLESVGSDVSDRIIFAKDTKTFQVYDSSSEGYTQLNETIAQTASTVDDLEAPSSDNAGNIKFIADTEELMVSTGSEWIAIGNSSVTLCATSDDLPTDGESGDIAIAKDTRILYFHNGTEWVSTVELITLSDSVSVTVGGITIGDTYTNKTNTEMWEALLLKELFGTLTAPSASLAKSPTTTYYNIGKEISLTLTTTFSRGSINPQYQSDSAYRSGEVTGYTYSGSNISTDTIASSATTNTQEISHTVTSGSQTWTSTVSYAEGCQPKSNKGNAFDSPLVAGSKSASTSISGTLPYYATTSDITDASIQSLVAITSTSLSVTFAGCTDANYWVIKVPPCWSITGFKDSDGEYLNGNQANSMLQWSVDTETIAVEGTDYTYKVYSYGADGAPKMSSQKITMSMTYTAL